MYDISDLVLFLCLCVRMFSVYYRLIVHLFASQVEEGDSVVVAPLLAADASRDQLTWLRRDHIHRETVVVTDLLSS